MSTRVTNSQLQSLIDRLNETTGNSKDAYGEDGNANIGTYYIDKAYSGNKLVQIMNKGGGVVTPLYTGYVTKRELYDRVYAFLCGINLGKGNTL